MIDSRINRTIALLESDQPVYYIGSHHGQFALNYENGRQLADTWADFLNIDMEHGPWNIVALHEFMRGLVDGGPTKSGHRTPTIIVECPVDGTSEQTVRACAWQFRQVLAAGVHGILLCHAETPGAVKAFVESCRYPFQKTDPNNVLGEGRRGSGGQTHAAQIWGISESEYLRRADPWPLNPKGELFLGLKIENKRALANVTESVRIPGIAFAEWGPGDMGMSLGFLDQHDPPYPQPMLEARDTVKQVCYNTGIRFLNMVSPDDVIAQLDDGVMVCSAHPQRGGEEAARLGRIHTQRSMPV